MINRVKDSIKTWLGISSQVEINEAEKTVLIPEGYKVVFIGDVHIKATGHLILESGRTIDSQGLVQGIWLNPDLDEKGNPILQSTQITEDNNGHGFYCD